MTVCEGRLVKLLAGICYTRYYGFGYHRNVFTTIEKLSCANSVKSLYIGDLD